MNNSSMLAICVLVIVIDERDPALTKGYDKDVSINSLPIF